MTAASRLKDSTKQNFDILFNELIVLSGAKFQNLDEAKSVREICYKYLLDSHPFVTLDEIKEAYIVRNQGKYGKEIYKELSYVSICDLLLDYEEYKKEQIGSFIQNQTLYLNEEVKPSEIDPKILLCDFLEESWRLANIDSFDRLRGVTVYDFLKELGFINLSIEEKREINKIAMVVFSDDKEKEKKMTDDISKVRSINHLLSNLDPFDSSVVRYSKQIALSHQIRNWQTIGKTFDEIKKEILK